MFDLFALTNPISRMFYKVIQCQILMDSTDRNNSPNRKKKKRKDALELFGCCIYYKQDVVLDIPQGAGK